MSLSLSGAYTEVPIGTIEIILILVFQILFLYNRAYTCLTDLILVLQSLFLYFESYTCITELILALRNLYLCYRAYSYILDTEVPVGTTEQIQRYP